jgi:penicillin-binding protein 1C
VRRAVRWRSPSEGLVIALDPDIPPLQQRLPLLLEGDPQGLRLRVDGVEATGSGLPEWWVPLPGTHKLELVDEAGTVRDSATVTVR